MTMSDLPAIDYDKLDPGIRRTVRFLRDRGYDTRESGDGRSKGWLKSRIPHVTMAIGPASMVDAAINLREDIFKAAVNPAAIVRAADVVATYYAVEGRAVVAVTGVDDAMLFGEEAAPEPADAACNCGAGTDGYHVLGQCPKVAHIAEQDQTAADIADPRELAREVAEAIERVDNFRAANLRRATTPALARVGLAVLLPELLSHLRAAHPDLAGRVERYRAAMRKEGT